MILKMKKKQLFKFIGQEYILAFLVAFVFFFFIFFINQILLLARRILLSNVDFFTMLRLVILAIPQFLLYTFPFASLSAAAMVIGELNSSNEILALRSSGFSMKDIYTPIISISLIISILCFLIADILMPFSASKYQQLYIELLTKSPGVELKSNSSNVFDDFLITNGSVKDSTINDIIILKTSNNGDTSMLIDSKKGELKLIDIDNLIYTLELDTPKILFTNLNNPNFWQTTKASKAIYYIDFSSTLSRVSANLPSNFSSVDLINKITKNKINLNNNIENVVTLNSSTILNLSKNFYTNNSMNNINMNSFVDDYNYYPLIDLYPIDFYLQYYRAELYKKFALSAACFFLILITIPLSYLKFKHGRLVGFGISMFVAVLYWYLLFLAQLKTFSFPLNPLFLMWAPNIIILVVSLIFIKIWRN